MDEEIETHRGLDNFCSQQVGFKPKQCDSTFSASTLYSYLVLPGSPEEYSCTVMRSSLPCKDMQSLSGGLGVLTDRLFPCISLTEPKIQISTPQRGKFLHTVDLHDLLQIVGTVTVESMNARALLYLLF